MSNLNCNPIAIVALSTPTLRPSSSGASSFPVAVAAAVAAADYVVHPHPHPLVVLSGRLPPACLASSPPPSCRVVCLQHASHHPLRPPSSSRCVICRSPTAGQHCNRLIAASSSSPLPLSSSRPLTALACHQHKDIAATIVDTTSSSPTNEGVHHHEESHGICHSRGNSSGTRNVVGITPPPHGAAAALPPQAPRCPPPPSRLQ